MTKKQEEALEALKSDNRIFVDADDIAPVLESNPQDIRDTAQVDVHQLGYPATLVKSRLKIPRKRFLAWLGE